MSRVHDMGGRFGDGPVVPEPEGEVFHQDWHARALALTLAAHRAAQANIDIGRFSRECLSPQEYTRFSYYERWISALADLLVERGVLTLGDLKGEGSNTPHPLADFKLPVAQVEAVAKRGSPSDRDSDVAQRFAIGDTVRTLRLTGNRRVEGGHTRLPRYAAGATGRILLTHGAHVLPDCNAHGLGEAPEPLYTVIFPASELWLDPEHPGDEVTLDLWQSYLEPA